MREPHGIEAVVARDVCIGNGICTTLAPHAFALDHVMKAVVLDPECESEDALMAAAEACPTQAIYLALRGAALYP